MKTIFYSQMSRSTVCPVNHEVRLSFCFRVVKKSAQAVLRHLQPNSETGKRSSSMVDLASITFQFFNLRLLLSKAISRRSPFPSFGKSLLTVIFAACSTKRGASTIGLEGEGSRSWRVLYCYFRLLRFSQRWFKHSELSKEQWIGWLRLRSTTLWRVWKWKESYLLSNFCNLTTVLLFRCSFIFRWDKLWPRL